MTVVARLFISLSVVFSSIFAETPTTVKLNDGSVVKGWITKTVEGREIVAFQGIPYAEAPIGDLRWKNPIGKKPWDGVLVANKSIMCPQMLGTTIMGEEDCLVINVYVPNDKSYDEKYPVMVWIHGGGFIYGSADIQGTGPAYILDKNLIIVAMNYRLNSFGFLSTGDCVAPGNYGLKDQCFALEWIQRNIPCFGGDPDRVTICGQSAGGVSVHLHTLAKKSQGLFDRCVSMSGTGLSPWGFRNVTEYRKLSIKLAELIGCPVNDSNCMIKCLRNASTNALLNASSVMFNSIEQMCLRTWGPTRETVGPDAFISEEPETIIDRGDLQVYPTIGGNTRDEGLLMSLGLMVQENLYKDFTKNLTESLRYALEPYTKYNDCSRLIGKALDYYYGGSLSSNKTLVIEQSKNFFGDAYFFYPELKTLKCQEKRNKNLYAYGFCYRGNMSWSTFGTWTNTNYGITHADDTLYLFPLSPASYGFPGNAMSAKDYQMKDIMVDQWTSFASFGKPNSTWKEFPLEEKFFYLGNESELTVKMDRDIHERGMKFWEENDKVY